MNKLFRKEKLLIVVTACMLISGCFSAPGYKGPKSDHFDGRKFQNSLSAKKKFSEYWTVSKEFFEKRSIWPRNIPVNKIDKLEYGEDEFSVTFIGHSTLIIRVDDITIITDPIFSKFASPIQGRGPSRHRQPAIEIEDLPHIDLILVSHNHYDHLDEFSVRTIVENQEENPPLILAPLGNSLLFREWGIDSAQDMDWGDSYDFADLEIELHENRHRTGRGLADQMKTLWGAFLIRSSKGNIYFGGDTGYGPHFGESVKRSGPMRLSLLPIGAYEPRWFMQSIHLDPFDAVQAHRDLESELSIGMHFGTFQLTTESINDPTAKLRLARQQYKLPDNEFIVLEFGQTLKLD